jgi:hypothetical protein
MDELPDPRSESFTARAQKLTRGQLLDLLLDVEDRLRVLIRIVFARERRDWETLLPKGMQSGSEAGDEGKDPLEKATLKQLIDTVLHRWKLFEPILDDKVKVQATLEEMRQYRNELAHGAQPTLDEKVEIALVVAKVGKRIPHIVHEPEEELPVTRGLVGRSIIWADDRPESNRRLRSLFTNLGATVVPVLSNDEAISEVSKRPFDVVISDIDRAGSEPGSQLGFRMHAVGIDIPIVYFIARYDPSIPPPVGAVCVTNDTAEVITRVFSILRPDAVGS